MLLQWAVSSPLSTATLVMHGPRHILYAIVLLLTGCAGAPDPAPAYAPSALARTYDRDATEDETTPDEIVRTAKTLDEYLAVALRQHPDLSALHARWRAEQARQRATQRLPDTMVSVTYAPLPIQTRLGPNHAMFGLTQPLPRWGTRDADAAIAARASGAAAARLDAKFLAIRAEVARLYWSLWEVDARHRLLAAQRDVVRVLVESMRGGVEVGRASGAELAQTSLILTELEDQREALGAERARLEAQFASALGLAGPPSKFVVSPAAAPAQAILPGDREALIAAAADHPHQQALQQVLATRRAQWQRQQVEGRPGLEVGAQWSLIGQGDAPDERAGRDAVAVRAGVRIPLWRDAVDARVDEAQAQVVAAQADLASATIDWNARLRAAYVEAADAQRRATLLRQTLLPQTRSALEMMEGEVEVGRAGVEALTRATLKVLEVERDLLIAEARYARSLATLTMLVGQPLETFTDAGGAP